MSQDLPCVSFMALYIISMHVMNSNSKTSTHWKLNLDAGKVQSAAVADDSLTDGDPLMSILTNKVTDRDGQWKLVASDCTGSSKEETEKVQSHLEPEHQLERWVTSNSVYHTGKPVRTPSSHNATSTRPSKKHQQ